MIRTITLKPNVGLTPCPKCQNKTAFSLNCAPSACPPYQIWLKCACGNMPPVEQMSQFEHADLSVQMLIAALEGWNQWLHSLQSEDSQEFHTAPVNTVTA